jgi:hypothetical protein
MILIISVRQNRLTTIVVSLTNPTEVTKKTSIAGYANRPIHTQLHYITYVRSVQLDPAC